MDQERTTEKGVSRRAFLGNLAAGAAFSIVPRHVLGGEGNTPPSEKLNVASIGLGPRGAGNTNNAARRENLVALCDCDPGNRFAAGTIQDFAGVPLYRDYRRMFEEMEGRIDAVIISTPDHAHFHAAMWAMQRGVNVYVEKPLTHYIAQARRLGQAAAHYGVVTQMGNQGHSSWSTALARDWIANGDLGQVREVIAWSNGSKWRKQPYTPGGTAPETLDYDLWLNRAPYRDYHWSFHPGGWRAWRWFGEGQNGDWGCHQLDIAFYSLDLRNPDTVRVETSGQWPAPNSYPQNQTVTWQFPARGDMAPVRLRYFIFDGKPVADVVPRPRQLGPDFEFTADEGTIIVGEDCCLVHGGHGGGARIYPEKKLREVGRPPEISPRVRGHMESWLEACKGRGRALSSFDYAAPLTQFVLLGEVALRAKDHYVEWDADAMRATNDEAVNEAVNGPAPRKGWATDT